MGCASFVKRLPRHKEDHGLAGRTQDVDGQPGRGRGLGDEPGELGAAQARGADLRRCDATTREVLGDDVGRVSEAAAGDERSGRVLVRARRESDVIRVRDAEEGGRKRERGQKTS
jgi:hypothetical protein